MLMLSISVKDEAGSFWNELCEHKSSLNDHSLIYYINKCDNTAQTLGTVVIISFDKKHDMCFCRM